MSDELTIVHLLRHGEVHNPDKILYGRLPGYFLSDLGKEMAERAASVLVSRDIAAVILRHWNAPNRQLCRLRLRIS